MQKEPKSPYYRQPKIWIFKRWARWVGSLPTTKALCFNNKLRQAEVCNPDIRHIVGNIPSKLTKLWDGWAKMPAHSDPADIAARSEQPDQISKKTVSFSPWTRMSK